MLLLLLLGRCTFTVFYAYSFFHLQQYEWRERKPFSWVTGLAEKICIYILQFTHLLHSEIQKTGLAALSINGNLLSSISLLVFHTRTLHFVFVFRILTPLSRTTKAKKDRHGRIIIIRLYVTRYLWSVIPKPWLLSVHLSSLLLWFYFVSILSTFCLKSTTKKLK